MSKTKEISALWEQIKPQIDEMVRLCYGVESHAEVTADAYWRGYEAGLNDAWEVSRKIIKMTDIEASAVFGTWLFQKIFEANSASEAIEKIRQYEQEQEEQITKGDVVRMKSVPEIEILVTCADGDYVSGIALTEMDDNCEIGDQYMNIVIHKVEKTGKHYDIAEVLRKMKGEN